MGGKLWKCQHQKGSRTLPVENTGKDKRILPPPKYLSKVDGQIGNNNRFKLKGLSYGLK